MLHQGKSAVPIYGRPIWFTGAILVRRLFLSTGTQNGEAYVRHRLIRIYSTVTDLAKFLGLSTSHPRSSATW